MGRKVPFLFKPQAEAVQRSFTEMLAELGEAARNQYIDSDNVQKYHHGETWVAHYASEPKDATTMMEVSHQLEIPMHHVVEGDFTLFEEYLKILAERFHGSFVCNLYQMVGDGAERIGNTVSAKGRSHAEAFLEMLDKIEFGVDKDGNVSLPEIHVAPSMGKEMIQSLDAQGDDFKKKIDKITEEKSKAALQREAERKAKFKK